MAPGLLPAPPTMHVSGIGPGQAEDGTSGGAGAGPAGPHAGGASGFGGLLALLGAAEPGARDGKAKPDGDESPETVLDAALSEALATLVGLVTGPSTPPPVAAAGAGTPQTPTGAATVATGPAPAVAGKAGAATEAVAAAGAAGGVSPAENAVNAVAGSAPGDATKVVDEATAAVPPDETVATATATKTATTAAAVAAAAPAPDSAAHQEISPATKAASESAHDEGAEPGRRETRGGAVVAGPRSTGAGGTQVEQRTGGGGPSAPSSPPSSTSTTSGQTGEHAGAPGGHASPDDRRTTPAEPETAPAERATVDASRVADRPAETPRREAVARIVEDAPAPAAPHAATAAAAPHAAPVAAAPQVDAGAHLDPPALAPPPHAPRPPEPPAPSPPPAGDVERFLSLARVRPVVRDDGGEMRLHVTPDGLGQVEVRVVVHADGVQAALTAHHDAARQTLEAHRPSLEAMLGRANLRLEGFSVGLGQERAGHEGERADGPQLPAGLPPVAEPAAVATTLLEPAVAAGGVNVRA